MARTRLGPRVRVHFDMTPEMRRLLDDMATSSGEGVSTVIRSAIALLKTVWEAEDRGQYPALIDAEGKVVARLVGVEKGR
jgi:hypothetical protein